MNLGNAQVTGYRFGDVKVDARRHRVVRGGTELALEPKAHAVLVELLRHAGDVVSRDALLDAVWGHRHVTPAVLNRIIAILRRELGDDAEHPRLIRTVHGIGYEFIGAFEAPLAPLEPEPAMELPSLPESQSPLPQPSSPPSSRSAGVPWHVVSWTLALLAASAAGASWMLWHRAAPPAAEASASPTSIAVLPLVNASGAADQQFFSDGLSDNLIDALSKFEGVKVIGRMSSFQFRDGKDDSKIIGAKLGADYLVGGSVQRANDIVRISTALTRTADGSTLWAEHYDRPYKDLFALQDEIAQAIATALHAKLGSASSAAAQSDRPPSGNIEAYDAYLQGLKYSREQKFTEAAKYLTHAVKLDPGYAMAWAYLSGCLSTIAVNNNTAPEVAREHMRTARLAADEALRHAPALGMAHAARAYLQFYNFDYRGALTGCRRAVQLAPDDVTILNGCGYTLAGIGKLAEAIRLRERVLSIEPLYLVNHFEYARLLTASGRLDEATKYLHIAEGLAQPNSNWHTFVAPYGHMAVALLRDDVHAAMDIATQAPAAYRDPLLLLATQIGSDRAAADAVLAKVIANDAWPGAWAYTRSYAIAQAYALRGDSDKAVEWLARASTHDLLFLLADPLILRLRDDPRLIALCAKTGLPPPAESEALGLDRIRSMSADKHQANQGFRD